jgi:hypothetical protein
MDDARLKLLEVIREARALVALPGNDFAWSDWSSVDSALEELDNHIALLERGSLPPLLALKILFAPTGSLQEVSIQSGWAEEFLQLAERFDHAATAVYA